MPDDPETNLQVFWKEALEVYDELDIPRNKRFGSLRMSMFAKV